MFADRVTRLQRRMAEADLDVALVTDDDNVYYLTGYYNYLHMEFGRPTILVVPREGETLLITPTIDLTMAEASAQVGRIAPWNDGRATNGAPSFLRSWDVQPGSGSSPIICPRWCEPSSISPSMPLRLPASRRTWPGCG